MKTSALLPLAALLLLCLVVPAHAGVLEAAPGVAAGDALARVVVDGEAAPELVRRLQTFLEGLDVVLPTRLGLDAPGTRLRVRVLPDAEALERTARRRAPALEHAGAWYDGATRTIVTTRTGRGPALAQHEAVHAALGDALGDPTYERYSRPGWPIWLDEGLAEVLSHDGTVAPHHVALLADHPASEATVDVKRLLYATEPSFTGPDAALYYASSAALVDLLLSDPTLAERLRTWLGALREGGSLRDGASLLATEALGLGAPALEERLRRHVRSLAEPAPTTLDLGAGGLDAWSRHGRGSWSAEGTTLHAAPAPIGAAWLVRSVPVAETWSLEARVDRQPSATVGVILGRHRVGVAPYHTAVNLGPRGVVVSHVTPDGVEVPSARMPLALAEGPVALRIEGREGYASIWVDGQNVLTTPLADPTLSLVGLRVAGDRAALSLPVARRYARGL